MVNLDDVNIYKKFDANKMAESINLLADQIEQTWVDAKAISIPASYKRGIDKVVINGMGGSNLGFSLINAVFRDSLKVPLIVTSGYEVPSYVDEHTLYIISSYSGNTEEPLSVYKKVKDKKAKILAITGKSLNNKLSDLIDKEKIPSFVFEPENNPSFQPRVGLGYAVFGAIKLLDKTGILKIKSQTAREVVAGIKGRNPFWTVNVKTNKNAAKRMAYKLQGKTIAIVASEFLEGNAHILRNQLNESSKNLAFYLISPDMNHHALEGLENPEGLENNIKFLFINSGLYNERIQKRNILARQMISQKGIEFEEINPKSRFRLAQALEVLQFGTWLTYYLSILNESDPASIPWVNWFKDRLK